MHGGFVLAVAMSQAIAAAHVNFAVAVELPHAQYFSVEATL